MKEPKISWLSKKNHSLKEKCIEQNQTNEKFGNENLSPKQFLEKYSLPRIVSIVPQKPIASTEGNDITTLLRGKLLIYRQYRGGKIEAKSYCDSFGGSEEYDEMHPSSTVVIPDTYEGWFSVVTERGQVKAQLYTSIQQLITSQVTAFLIVSPDLVGYVQNTKKPADGMRNQYTRVCIKQGQVLKLLAVYQDIASQSTRSKRLSWPLLGTKHETTRYAQCMTYSKQITYIPVTSHGQFYSVSMMHNTSANNISRIYQINKLLQIFPLPVRVCTIPSNKSQGSILLETYTKEDVMLACTLDSGTLDKSQKFRFLEIDVNSKFYVNRVSDEEKLFKTARVQEALRNCYSKSDKWCQQLKVIHHIYPQTGIKNQPTENKEIKMPNKKDRKISLGDRKTVKSASFRYSTSYNSDNNTKSHRRNVTNATNYYNEEAPIYLNKAPNIVEDNRSSLPVQRGEKGNRSQQVISQNVISENRLPLHTGYQHQDVRRKQNVSGEEKTSYYKAPQRKEPQYFIEDCRNYNKVKSRSQHTPNSKSIVPKMEELITHEQPSADDSESTKYSCSQVTLVKKINQPVYRTTVKIELETPYSSVIDAIETNSTSTENTYAEIGENANVTADRISATRLNRSTYFAERLTESSYGRSYFPVTKINVS